MRRNHYRLLLLVELIAAFSLPVGLLGYGVVMLVMMLASAVIDQTVGYTLAIVILAIHIGFGVLGLWAVGRLAVAELRGSKYKGRLWLVLIASLAGIVGWIAVTGGPFEEDLHSLWRLSFWAPIVVGIQLLAQNWRRLKNLNT